MKNFIVTIFILIISAAAFAQKRYVPPTTPAEQLNKTYCTGLFSTADGVYFDLENDNTTLSAYAYFNVLDWLQGRVAGLKIYTSRTGMKFPVIRNMPAAIFVDEIRMDASFLNMLPVADIAMIKVIKSPFLGGFGGPGGAIAIYTKRGDAEEEEEV